LDAANPIEGARRAERRAHEIYGLVIITATLVADRQYATLV